MADAIEKEVDDIVYEEQKYLGRVNNFTRITDEDRSFVRKELVDIAGCSPWDRNPIYD